MPTTMCADDRRTAIKALDSHANGLNRLYHSVMPRQKSFLEEERKCRSLALRLSKMGDA